MYRRLGPLVSKGIREAGAFVLSFVLLYTASSKLYDWEGTQLAFANQVFPIWLSARLAWAAPTAELAIAALLLFPTTRILGFKLASGLFLLFTGYVALVLTGIFGRIPCSCGGIVSTLGWSEHLVLNIVLLATAILGYRLEKIGQSKINIEKS